MEIGQNLPVFIGQYLSMGKVDHKHGTIIHFDRLTSCHAQPSSAARYALPPESPRASRTYPPAEPYTWDTPPIAQAISPDEPFAGAFPALPIGPMTADVSLVTNETMPTPPASGLILNPQWTFIVQRCACRNVFEALAIHTPLNCGPCHRFPPCARACAQTSVRSSVGTTVMLTSSSPRISGRHRSSWMSIDTPTEADWEQSG